MALTDKLTAIGDAIREKTGSTDKLTLDEMVTEIGSIEGGEIIEIDTHEGEDWLIISSYIKEIYENDRVTQVGPYGGSSIPAYVVDLPNVTSIRQCSFKGNTYIKKLNLPQITNINTEALQDTSNLKVINAPNINSLSESGLENLAAEYISFPKLKTITGMYSIRNPKRLSCINFPNLEDASAVIYGDSGEKLKYLCLPKLTYLDTYAFNNCKALTILDLPSVTSIAKPSSSYASPFYNCNSLQAIILRSETLVPAQTIIGTLIPKITSVPTYIYVPSALLEEYKAATNWSAAADYIRAIEDYPDICDAPIGCYYDEEATTVNLIKTQTAGHVSLTGIHAPKATAIYAKYSNNLIYVNAPLYAVARNGDFLGCSKLNYLDLPSLYCVYQDAFMDCTTLKKVEFTADKKATIYANAFRNCSALKTVILRHEGAVATIAGAHEGANSALTYYVPSSLLASYQETYPDYTFATIEDHPEIEYAECV